MLGWVPWRPSRGVLEHLAMQLLHQGKVRDVYADGPDEVVLVATDRISVYDVVLPTPVPGKGAILNTMSAWWFDQLADVVPNHVITLDGLGEFGGRAMRCKPVGIIPVECIARGYLAGGGWDLYKRHGAICGVGLPEGLVLGDRLPEPIFTPTTKTPPEKGHDEPMTFEDVVDVAGAEMAARLRDLTLNLYRRAAAISADHGVILVDTKFEFGIDPSSGELVWADEALTTDSSRYWRVEDWEPGQQQIAWDKQYVRDWASDLDWDKRPPGPEMPPEVVAETRLRYLAMYERITGLTPFGWFQDGELDEIRLRHVRVWHDWARRMKECRASGAAPSQRDLAMAELAKKMPVADRPYASDDW